ncbi:MAG: hypothetical protein WAQ75_04275 [Propionicimonas sp.]
MTDDEDEDFTPWTQDGATRLRQAADALLEAIRTHAASLTGVTGEEDAADVFAAGNLLVPALLAYADAQFDFTGTGFPLGVLHQFFDDDDEDDEDDGNEGPSGGVSVLRRSDYVVTDENAVMEAGRQAYRRSTGEADPRAAAADVTHLGAALYQIAHADGWDRLGDIEGLQPTAGIVLLQSSDELLGGDPDDWPEDDLFDYDDGRLLYRQDDIFGG